jgi:hypothetical protein
MYECNMMTLVSARRNGLSLLYLSGAMVLGTTFSLSIFPFSLVLRSF